MVFGHGIDRMVQIESVNEDNNPSHSQRPPIKKTRVHRDLGANETLDLKGMTAYIYAIGGFRANLGREQGVSRKRAGIILDQAHGIRLADHGPGQRR